MAIPIIGQVLDLVDAAVDKIWPDADTKEQGKQAIKMAMMSQAMTEQKLLFEDTEGARELFKAELEVQKAPVWTRAFQVMARPFAMYSCISMYVWVKIAPLFEMPTIALGDRDYWLIGSVFIFLFGARTFEKIKSSA